MFPGRQEDLSPSMDLWTSLNHSGSGEGVMSVKCSSSKNFILLSEFWLVVAGPLGLGC